ncbi:hypothetical protein BC938DRAFT_483281 [Jimgerdemannia flammicorona]|uniref:Uncharacterized protein n=1 Tax=Jimgerdemannia flammicorona TaxID=994334 RepID=A0A433QCF3_9FUNG|nr:hypothetical protein BC938DRAFT_483281 [Jimgerdemannia flammicorona]
MKPVTTGGCTWPGSRTPRDLRTWYVSSRLEWNLGYTVLFRALQVTESIISTQKRKVSEYVPRLDLRRLLIVTCTNIENKGEEGKREGG